MDKSTTMLAFVALLLIGLGLYFQVLLPWTLRRQIAGCKTRKEAEAFLLMYDGELKKIAKKKLQTLEAFEREQWLKNALEEAFGSEEKLLLILLRVTAQQSPGDPVFAFSFVLKVLHVLRPFTEERIREATMSSELWALKKGFRISGDLEVLYAENFAILVLQEAIVATNADADCFGWDLDLGIVSVLLSHKKKMLQMDVSTPGRQRAVDELDMSLKRHLVRLDNKRS